MQPSDRASKKQQELLSYLDGFIKEAGYGPSYREIMRALGYKSVSTVAVHVDSLVAKGYLTRRDNSARSLEVVSLTAPAAQAKHPDLAGQISDLIETHNLSKTEREGVWSAMKLLGVTKPDKETHNAA
jgi:SOS-response transcriptional repressor LexA